MRIVFDHQIFGWQRYGGISRYIYTLAAELATSFSQEVSIISPIYVNSYLANAPPQLYVVGRSVPMFPKCGRFYRAVNSVLAWPKIQYVRPDVVHETYYSARRVAPKRAKIVLTVHDMIHERFREFCSPLDPTRREKALAVRRADHVICVSENTRKDLIELLGVDPGKTSVVYHGVNDISETPSSVSAIHPARPFLLYVGNRDRHKNFRALLRVFAASSALVKDFDLVCFGGGDFTANERELMRRLGVPSARVRQISGDDAVLAGFYRNARALVYPSLYEGFGIPPLEAMSCRCPVACSAVSSIPEVVGEAGEMFDPDQPDSMRMAIERVAGDETLRKRLIVKGLERVKQFTWERCAESTLRIYDSLQR